MIHVGSVIGRSRDAAWTWLFSFSGSRKCLFVALKIIAKIVLKKWDAPGVDRTGVGVLREVSDTELCLLLGGWKKKSANVFRGVENDCVKQLRCTQGRSGCRVYARLGCRNLRDVVHIATFQRADSGLPPVEHRLDIGPPFSGRFLIFRMRSSWCWCCMSSASLPPPEPDVRRLLPRRPPQPVDLL